jgi:hypothetical protein
MFMSIVFAEKFAARTIDVNIMGSKSNDTPKSCHQTHCRPVSIDFFAPSYRRRPSPFIHNNYRSINENVPYQSPPVMPRKTPLRKKEKQSTTPSQQPPNVGPNPHVWQKHREITNLTQCYDELDLNVARGTELFLDVNHVFISADFELACGTAQSNCRRPSQSGSIHSRLQIHP